MKEYTIRQWTENDIKKKKKIPSLIDRKIYRTLKDVRKQQCKYAKKNKLMTYIYLADRYGKYNLIDRGMVEVVHYDAPTGKLLIQTRGRFMRVSPKTGNLLDLSKYRRYL